MSRASRIARRVGLVLLATLGALALCEVALRVVDPFRTGEIIAREVFQDAILERHPTRDQAVLRAGAHARFLGQDVAINAARMRGPDVPLAKAPGVYRIVVAGDSVAFGWGVAEQDAFPRVLERVLNEGDKPPGIAHFEVVNGGVPGWGIPEYYKFLEETGLAYAPDLVVVTFINNDLTDYIRVIDPAGAADPLLTLPSWAEPLYLARAVKHVHDVVAGAKGDFFLEIEGNPRLVDPAVDSACEHFGLIRTLCGATPLVVFDTIGDEKGHRLARFADGLAARGIPRVEAFLPRADYARDLAVTPIDVHPNARGHRLYTDWLLAWMRRELWH